MVILVPLDHGSPDPLTFVGNGPRCARLPPDGRRRSSHRQLYCSNLSSGCFFSSCRGCFFAQRYVSGVDAAFDAIVEDSRGEWVSSCYVNVVLM